MNTWVISRPYGHRPLTELSFLTVSLSSQAHLGLKIAKLQMACLAKMQTPCLGHPLYRLPWIRKRARLVHGFSECRSSRPGLAAQVQSAK
jgi:hypothetical protein